MKPEETPAVEIDPDVDVDDDVRVLAPWERVFHRFLTPLERFVQQQTASGILLLAAAVVAMLLANTDAAEVYHHVLETPLGVSLNAAVLEMSLHHWINEGLMTLFFFVVGLEIKREVLVGELSRPRQALLPMIAALGGMVVPAGLYLSWVAGTEAQRGWGIPMATDIAFAIGALVLLGNRVPRSLMTFLLALAIVDDLGALVVIALFYSNELDASRLALAAVTLGILIIFNRAGLRRPWPYFTGCTVVWLLLLDSGVHATIAGVATAFVIPVLPKYRPARFVSLFECLMQRYRDAVKRDENPLRNDELRATLQTMENALEGVRSPLARLLYHWETPVALAVIPLFALANAGVSLTAVDAALFHQPVVTGVLFGLLIGKPLGICGSVWLAVRSGVCQLPTNVRFAHIVGVSLLAGIGFTMSLFIAGLAFPADQAMADGAKLAILFASIIAGGAGLAWLRFIASSSDKSSLTP